MSWRATTALRAGAAGLALAAMLMAGSAGADSGPAEFELTYADQSAVVLLATARAALTELESEAEVSERRIKCATAVTALVRLYQLHGCEWALEPLLEVYAHPDCPDLHLGYSADGRLELRLEPLELLNPAFADHTVYLCTLSSHTALDLSGSRDSTLTITLLTGERLTAQQLSRQHVLWPQLERLADTFEPPPYLLSGGGLGFKQLFALPDLCPDRISTVSLGWGDYELIVPYFENEVGL